jgi:hypothetical protein
MTEIRVQAMGPRGDSAWFEINRWHQVGTDWYRIEMIRNVKKGAEAGGTVNLASPGEGVTIYKAGERVEGPGLRALGGGSIDMSVGKFEGLGDGREARMVKLGAEKFDLSGAIYR